MRVLDSESAIKRFPCSRNEGLISRKRKDRAFYSLRCCFRKKLKGAKYIQVIIIIIINIIEYWAIHDSE